jgi:hypothetical protein
LDIEIRSPNPAEIRAEQRLLKQGEKWETSFNTFGMEGTNGATLEISDLPAVNLEKRLGYLLNTARVHRTNNFCRFPALWMKNISC